MIPVLYASTATVFGQDNGLGLLFDAVECVVEETINEEFVLALKYPVNGIHFSEIGERCIIYAKPSPSRSPEPFRVTSNSIKIGETVEFQAQHISYDLKGYPVMPFEASAAAEAVSLIASNQIRSCPFSFETTIETQLNDPMKLDKIASAREILGDGNNSLVTKFKGELEYSGYTVKLVSARGGSASGQYRPVLRYGTNLMNFSQDKDIAEVYTGIVGYYKNSSSGAIVKVYRQLGDSSETQGYENTTVVDLSSKFSSQPSEDEVDAKLDEYILDYEEKLTTPDITITVDQTDFRELEFGDDTALEIGNYITVYSPRHGISVTDMRVVTTKYNVLSGHYNSFDIGRVKHDIASTIASQSSSINTLSGGGTSSYTGGGGSGTMTAVFG